MPRVLLINPNASLRCGAGIEASRAAAVQAIGAVSAL